MAWKIKLNTNDVLRQKFIDQTVPQIEYLGLDLPDKDLKWNEARGHYDYGQIYWVDFFNVVKGKGPAMKSAWLPATRRGTTARGFVMP